MSKHYPHLISKLFCEPLLVTRARHAAMVRVLEARMAQGMPDQMPRDMPDDPEEDMMPDWQTFGADAIIPVHGVLVGHASDIPISSCGCGLDDVGGMIDVAMADSEVQKLIFDFRSPGGAVTGIPELARKIAGITSKRTIAFTDSECCSGALWLAEQCQYFYCTGSASVGSIGVWCAYLDVSRQMENAGQHMQEISAGKYKTMGAYWKPMSSDERAMVQKDVDRIFAQFKEAVNLRREVSEEFMQGQIFDGEQALENGLVDGLVEDMDELLEQ